MADLRELLPSVDELSQSLRSKKAAMIAAIAKKQFVAAEKLNVEVEELEKTYANEKSKASATQGLRKQPTILWAASSPRMLPIRAPSTVISIKLAISVPVMPSASRRP